MNLPDIETARTDYGKVAFRRNGAGVPLVLLHGLGGSSRSWGRQYDDLADRFRIIAWDCPGYGASTPHPDPEPNAGVYAAVLAGMLDALHLDTVDLLGHSMGGAVAARFAIDHPNRVRRLILSATKATFMPDAEGFRDRLRERETMPIEEFAKARARGMIRPDSPPDVFERVASVARDSTVEGYRAAVSVLASTDNTDLLRRLDKPTMVLAGANDRIAPPEATEHLASLIPGARRVEIPGAAHGGYIEAPDAWNAAVSSFLLEG